MNSIQRKIFVLSLSVLSVMVFIWVILTYYNYKTQEQYDTILQRYLLMNEATHHSRDTVKSLNEWLLDPSDGKLADVRASQRRMLDAKDEMSRLTNEYNWFTLTNYTNMIDSLSETTDLTIMFVHEDEREEAQLRFAEATRIEGYISEMSLSLIDQELNTYDEFYRGIIRESAELNRIGLWLLVVMTVVLLLVAYGFSRSITKPIQKLTFAARELSRGRFDVAVDVRTNDEISFLAMTFDRMRTNINELISEIQRKAQLEHELQENKLLLKESQLRSLQSQIQPHFLFNTLDTLSKKAYLEGAEQTSDLIANVAGMLRYNLRRLDRAVTLGDEREALLKYVEVQQARFAERLAFEEDIDERLLDVELPCLTLQPIVENAIIHAVEPMEEGGRLRIRIYEDRREDERAVMVEIEDNGAGMSEDRVSALLEGNGSEASSGHSTGIGVGNVVRRLRLFFGDDDVIRIRSAPGRGTTVVLRLPQRRKSV